MTSIPLFLTQEHDCSYLDGKVARSAFVHPSCTLTPALYAQLIRQGFRRSGDDVYKPYCRQCSACLPSRLVVSRFKPNRAQQRCWKKNTGTQAIIKPPVFDQAHYEMYMRYQATRHRDGDMAHSSPDDYLGFLSSAWSDTQFVEFLIYDELAGVAVIDLFQDSWSAVYTFFEPKFASLSPGVYAVLWQIEQLRKQQREFLYLGFWIKGCKKMEYKSAYQPMQLLVENQWVDMPV
ncbi:MAG: arginyltransferase [Methylovulum sp.]|nr:arginyltransferase [Methylovulum sp.]